MKTLTINELIEKLLEIKEANREPELPNLDPGTMEVFVQDDNGIYESGIISVEDANGPWLIVKTPEE